MKNKRQLIFRAAALLIILIIAAAMFVIGRGHTIYIDNKSAEYEGQTIEAFYKVNVDFGDGQTAKLSARDRGMADIMGQKVTMNLEITDEKGSAPRTQKITLPVPYDMDGLIINIPALAAGLPRDAYMEEFVITPAAEDTEDQKDENSDSPGGMDSGEFEMGDI